MRRTILVVDDNPEERAIFSAYLHFVGARLLEAADGAAALDLAREHTPDLILLDLTMPVMDGWEAIRRLAADPELRRIPVVAITAHHLPWERLREAGFSGYLEKPLSPHAVLLEVERCLGPMDGEEEPPAEPPSVVGSGRLPSPVPRAVATADGPAPQRAPREAAPEREPEVERAPSPAPAANPSPPGPAGGAGS